MNPFAITRKDMAKCCIGSRLALNSSSLMTANSNKSKGMEKPVRAQLSRRHKLPPNTVSVARPGRWGNPFTVKAVGLPAAIEAFREMMDGGWNPTVFNHLSDADYLAACVARDKWLKRLRWQFPWEGAVYELRGKNLACFCPLNQPCHADVLLEIANA